LYTIEPCSLRLMALSFVLLNSATFCTPLANQ
jgi:hypothetical protein